jgi:acyl carrier protein
MDTDTTRKLLAIVSEVSGSEEQVTLEHTFEKLGMDSLDFILMIQQVREKIGTISDADAARCETVGDLIDHVYA